jgi:hypothetical protein
MSQETPTQLDRIEAELTRLHQRLDAFEQIAAMFGGTKFLALLGKVKQR